MKTELVSLSFEMDMHVRQVLSELLQYYPSLYSQELIQKITSTLQTEFL
jgi:hypothetical protein